MESYSVHKFELNPRDEPIEMPAGADLLHVHSQFGGDFGALIGESLFIWARVRTDGGAPLVKRQLYVRGTGHNLGPGKYVGSAHMANGQLVWHVFDAGEVVQ